MCDCKLENQDGNNVVKSKKPLVLCAPHYKRLLDTVNEKELRAKKDAKDQNSRNWLKTEGEALNARYKGQRQPTLNEKLELQRADLMRKVEQSTKTMDKFKENDEQMRRNKIAKAEKMLEKAKPGPRQLQTAAMQSEVLRERNVQMNIKEEFDRILKEEEDKLLTGCVSLNNPWIKDEIDQAAEKKANNNNYKKDLMDIIEQNAKNRAELKQQLLLEQRAERERIDREIKRQIDRERLAMEKKRAILRKNAVEAMKMVEQRRLRECMINEVEDRLNCVYNKGKRELNQMLKQNEENIAEARLKTMEENVKLCWRDTPKNLGEEERLQRDISRMQLKFSQLELEKKQRDKAAKQARIEAHLREVERQKKAQQLCCEKQRYEMAQRFKNEEVNNAFVQKQMEERLRQMQQFRSMFKEQMADKERIEKEEQEAICNLDDPYIQDDHKFFALARDYITDAKKKDRPLYPFIKAVEQYKRENQIDCVSTLPKHLISKISIGCRQAGDSKADALYANKLQLQRQKDADSKQKVLEECRKTHELLVNSVAQQQANGICGRELRRKACFKVNSSCGDNAGNQEAPSTLPVANKRLSSAQSEDQHSLIQTIKSVDSSSGGDSKIRYSVSQLKNINQDQNPSKVK